MDSECIWNSEWKTLPKIIYDLCVLQRIRVWHCEWVDQRQRQIDRNDNKCSTTQYNNTKKILQYNNTKKKKIDAQEKHSFHLGVLVVYRWVGGCLYQLLLIAWSESLALINCRTSQNRWLVSHLRATRASKQQSPAAFSAFNVLASLLLTHKMKHKKNDSDLGFRIDRREWPEHLWFKLVVAQWLRWLLTFSSWRLECFVLLTSLKVDGGQ